VEQINPSKKKKIAEQINVSKGVKCHESGWFIGNITTVYGCIGSFHKLSLNGCIGKFQ